MTETKQTYVCHICGKHTHTLDGFLGHLKIVHNINLDEFILSCTQYDLSNAKCPICGKLRNFKANGITFAGKTCGRKDCIQNQKE